MTIHSFPQISHGRFIPHTAQMAMQLGGGVFKHLVGWIVASLKKYESIDIYPWTDNFWYVVVKDVRQQGAFKEMAVGFTIDVEEDRIFWANDQTYAGLGFTEGGNCFCRSYRWWRLMSKQYPHATSDRKLGRKGTVHDYRPRRLKAKEA